MGCEPSSAEHPISPRSESAVCEGATLARKNPPNPLRDHGFRDFLIPSVAAMESHTYNKVDLGGHECLRLLHGEVD